MENWITASWDVLWKSALTILLIFVAIIFITRVFGLRTFAKMSSFDFAATIAIGSILASVIMNAKQSVLKGAIALLGIISIQYLFSFATRKSSFFESLLTNDPLLLMVGSNILFENLARANISKDELIAKLREANVIQLSQVKAVVLESTGDISVLHSEADDMKLDDVLLESVRKN